MEMRKIQVTGGSTHVVSLPKKWVDRSGLGRSDLVAIHEETDGSLLVVPHTPAKSKSRTIQLDLPDDVSDAGIVRRLVGAYLAGADEIRLVANGRMDPHVRKVIRNAIRDLVGVEMLEETSEAVTLQDLVGASDMDLRKTVTRMQRIARIMFDDALIALAQRDNAIADDVTGRDDELDRLEWHVSKQMHALLEQPRLAARLQVRPAEALNFFLVARAIERMGDHASKICRNIRVLPDEQVPAAVLTSILAQADAIRRVWDDAFTALKRNEFDLASKAVDHGKTLGRWRAELGNLVGDLDGDIVGPLTLIGDSVDRTRGYAIDIAETAMNQTFQA